MNQIIRLLPFNNVVASGVATCDLNNLLGYTIERLILSLGGTTFTKAMITGIQLKLNGKIIFDDTGSNIDARQQYRGITANAGFLTIDLSEIRSKTQLGQAIGALDTTYIDPQTKQGVSQLRLEVTISGATAPTLIGWAEVAEPQTDKAQAPTRGLIARVHKSTVTIGAAGQFALAVPHFYPSDGGSIFKRICVFSTNMTALLVKKNGVIVHDTIAAENNYNQTEYRKAPQASLYVADWIIDDNQSNILNTRDAQTMECLATFSAGETITIVSELLEPFSAY